MEAGRLGFHSSRAGPVHGHTCPNAAAAPVVPGTELWVTPSRTEMGGSPQPHKNFSQDLPVDSTSAAGISGISADVDQLTDHDGTHDREQVLQRAVGGEMGMGPALPVARGPFTLVLHLGVTPDDLG